MNAVAASILVGALGLALSCVALFWQAATFFMSGPRIKVKMLRGIVGPHGALVFGVSTSGASSDGLEQQGYTEQVLAVEVRNVGRMPVTVTAVKAVFQNGMSYQQLEHPLGLELPYRLDAQSQVTWFLPYAKLREIARLADETQPRRPAGKVRLSIELGNGKTQTTKQRLRLQ